MLSLEHTHACECVHNIRTYICCLFDSVSFRYTTTTRQCSISFSPSLSHAAFSLFLFLRILKKTRKKRCCCVSFGLAMRSLFHNNFCFRFLLDFFHNVLNRMLFFWFGYHLLTFIYILGFIYLFSFSFPLLREQRRSNGLLRKRTRCSESEFVVSVDF